MKRLASVFIVVMGVVLALTLPMSVTGQNFSATATAIFGTATALSQQLNNIIEPRNRSGSDDRSQLMTQSAEILGRGSGRPLDVDDLGTVLTQNANLTDSILVPSRATITPRPSATPHPTVNSSSPSTTTTTIDSTNRNDDQRYLLRPLRNLLLGWVGYWLVGMIILFTIGNILNSLGMRTVRVALENPMLKPNLMEHLIGFVYRSVIVLLVVFFYLSLILLFSLITVAGFDAALQFSNNAILLLIGGLFVAWGVWQIGKSLYKGLIVSPPVVDGKRLARHQYPELWKILYEVAEKVGTRPVDGVYLVPGAQIGVWEQGSLFGVLFGQGERFLMLGLAAFDGLTQQQFRSILAHEYGHFYNRDTTFGGYLSLKVLDAIQRIKVWMVITKRATWFNPIWVFLRFFTPMFGHVTLGASCFQEVVADRQSALAYGAQTAQDALKHTLYQHVRFDFISRAIIDVSLRSNTALPNLFRANHDENAEQFIQKELERLMRQPYTTHPPPYVRVAFWNTLEAKHPTPADANPQPAFDLLPDLEALEQEMMAVIANNIRRQLILMQVMRNMQQRATPNRRRY